LVVVGHESVALLPAKDIFQAIGHSASQKNKKIKK